MITVPAIRIQQFGQTFYQASLSTGDVERLVAFEVLDYTVPSAPRRPTRRRSERVNWQLLERIIQRGSEAYQRPVIHRKIEELARYYFECSQSGNHQLPAIPGAVILVARRRLDFVQAGENPSLGLLQIPSEAGVLHALDGQHRLLALRTATLPPEARKFQVPAVILDRLTPEQEVELFATINCKQTRLNPSLLIGLAGRRLYRDEHLVWAHDIVRRLNEEAGSALYHQIRMLGVGPGKVPQAPLAMELATLLREKRLEFDSLETAKRFFINYFRQIARTFPTAWNGRKYSIKTGIALQAFIRVSPLIVKILKQKHYDPADAVAIREAVAPWAERLGDHRFETHGEWRDKLAGGVQTSVSILARELQAALEG